MNEANPISIPYPEAADRHLKITVGACRLKVAPGAADVWVTGTYRDPSGSLPLKIDQVGTTVRISQAPEWANVLNLPSGIPTLDLALGTGRPFALTLESGASENEVDLGAVPINRMIVRQGAGKMTIDFSATNPEPMSLLTLSAGAGSVEVKNLANANLAEMTVDGGAVAYKLDFGGSLQRNAHVRVSTGMASVEIRVPSTTAARISTESVLGNLDIGDGFTKREGAFWTSASPAGTGPLLSIHASVALGSLSLRAT